ncbi:MAG: CoA transferase [Ilumatobacteraceae bacterium]
MLDRGGPLAGVRVVDVGDGSARFAGKVLAELGAHVVRLRRGEPGPAMVDAPGGVLDWWFDGGTDLADADADGDDLVRLIESADILVEAGSPSDLLERRWDNPRLSHVILTPFGIDGPRASWQGSDLVMTAAGGILSVTGTPDEPVTIWGRQMDNIGGLYAAICALTGLFRARTTGHGTTFDVSHQHGVVSCSEQVLMFWWWPAAFEPIGGPIAQRQMALHWSRIYDVVPCKRGFCMVSPSAGGVPDLLAWMASARPRARAGRRHRHPCARQLADGRAAGVLRRARRHRGVRRRPGASRPVRRGAHRRPGRRVAAAHRPRLLPPGRRHRRRRPRAVRPLRPRRRLRRRSHRPAAR